MSWLSTLFGGGVKEVIGAVGDVIDELHTSGPEKAQAKIALEKVISERMAMIESSTQARWKMTLGVIESENQSGSNYVKNARPTLVYVGLGAILFNYCIVPMAQQLFGATVEPYALPMEFWAAWGGTVAVWSAGRSAERRGVKNKVVQGITGSDSLDKWM